MRYKTILDVKMVMPSKKECDSFERYIPSRGIKGCWIKWLLWTDTAVIEHGIETQTLK